MVYQTYNSAQNINDNFRAYVGGIRAASGPFNGLNEGSNYPNYETHFPTTHIWLKPKGSKFIIIGGIGAGGGGAGGAASPTGFAAGGGGGGGHGQSFLSFLPSFMVPNRLYVAPGEGGQGGLGGVLGASGNDVSVSGSCGGMSTYGILKTFPTPLRMFISPNNQVNSANTLAILGYPNLNPRKSSGGTSATAGTGEGGGGGGSSSDNAYNICRIGLGSCNTVRYNGRNGSITSDGPISYPGNLLLKYGTGGGGASSNAYRGGYLSSLSIFTNYSTYGDVNYGSVSGAAGAGSNYYGPVNFSNGFDKIFTNYLPFYGFGAANGGAGNINGNGGDGGHGGIGCGGGGGGGAIGSNGSGIKGGDGGNGGPGAFLFWSIK